MVTLPLKMGKSSLMGDETNKCSFPSIKVPRSIIPFGFEGCTPSSPDRSQVTVCVSPAFHTDPAFGFVIGGAIESRGMSVSGLARAVPKRARRDTTCMMTKNMVMTA